MSYLEKTRAHGGELKQETVSFYNRISFLIYLLKMVQ